MVKMVIGEVQTQTEEIKAFGQSYSQALDAVSSATQGIQLAIGMTGAGMDSIKGYLSSVYPALCKAAIMHSEAVVQANEQYVQGYLSKCGSEDLDSDELQAQIDEADALIQGFQNSKDSYTQQKRSLSEEKDKLLGAVFQAAIVGMDAGIARNQAKKAKIQEKLDKFMDFCGQSDSYFAGLNNTGSIVAKGMQALGVSEKGQVGAGCWNGKGFSLTDRSWITTTNKNWQTRLEVKDKKLLDGCTIIHVVDTDRGVDMFMFEKNGRRYPVSEQDLSDNLRTLVKRYSLNVVELSPTEMDRRVTEFQKSGKDYFSGETVNMPGFKTLAKGQGIVNDLKDSGFWDAAWAAGLTVAAVRNAQNSPKTGNRFNIDKIRSKLKTERDSAFFWSGRTDGIGGAEKAATVAKGKGGVTLESTIDAKNIKMPEWDFNKPDSMKAWDLASGAYAEQVSGEVRAVVGAELRQGNIWENVELPRLKSNPNVTKITTIDPKTGLEKIIFERK